MNNTIFYKITTLDNGDVLLEKNKIDKDNYIGQIMDNGDILLKKIDCKNITSDNYEDLDKYNFCFSSIVHCSVNGKSIDKLKYKSILHEIYNIINCGSLVIKNTSLNIKTTKIKENGYYYIKSLGISIQGAESRKVLLEIVLQSILNKIKLLIKIKLKDNQIINICL